MCTQNKLSLPLEDFVNRSERIKPQFNSPCDLITALTIDSSYFYPVAALHHTNPFLFHMSGRSRTRKRAGQGQYRCMAWPDGRLVIGHIVIVYVI